jgi:hypothetical protein
MGGDVMAHITIAESQDLLVGIIAAAALSWPALAGNEVAPNFMPDATTGWIAGAPDSETPIGDDFPSAAVWAGASYVRQGPSFY